jgi:hypothetical protein
MMTALVLHLLHMVAPGGNALASVDSLRADSPPGPAMSCENTGSSAGAAFTSLFFFTRDS